MLARAALVLSLVAVAVAGCGTDCGDLVRQMHAVGSGPSRCVADADCAVYVGLCIDSPDGCGHALDAADRARMDQLQQQFIDAACPTDPNAGACACRIGTEPAAVACTSGACACVGGSCLVSQTM
jgi:hypothetical protein